MSQRSSQGVSGQAPAGREAAGPPDLISKADLTSKRPEVTFYANHDPHTDERNTVGSELE